MRRFGAVVALCLVGAVGSALADTPANAPTPAPGAPPTNAKQAEADRLFDEGRDFAAKKQWKAACDKFEQANQLDPLAAGTKLNLGLCYEELGKFGTALKWYREAAARAAETNLPDHEKAAKEHMVSLATKVPSLTIEFPAPAPQNPTVTLDGEAISPSDFGHVELDPGKHVLIAKAPGKKNAREDIVLAEKQNKTISITMVDGSSNVVLDPGKRRRYIAYGLVGVSAGFWGATIIYGIQKRIAWDCFRSTDPGNCSGDNLTEWNSLGNTTKRDMQANHERHLLDVWGSTMFTVGAVAFAGAAVLYFTAPERQTVEATASIDTIAPIVTQDQVGFALTGRF